LKDCKTNLLVTSLDLISQEPYFFKSYDDTPNYFLWQVGRATSAAQTYFPGFELDGSILWDGGNCANNPAAYAVADAVKLWKGERLKVLSLGCGAAKANINPLRLINAGIVRAGLASVGLLFETGAEDTDYQLEQALGDDYMSLQPKFARNVALDDASEEGLSWLNEAAMGFVTDNGVEVYNFLNT
jgi:patatin-like phospholipase/acyl hydrolase